jgi:hypothetical protein
MTTETARKAARILQAFHNGAQIVGAHGEEIADPSEYLVSTVATFNVKTREFVLPAAFAGLSAAQRFRQFNNG